ncbi:MAG: transglutaminase [Oceanospirillaceae bacterium]|nr:transglutaminase [Oceanospirillaceae bacterium]|tara:strand:+ start:163791 stop:165803 length:2013 start_codon:yes stop_codon:yes gene_type:complete
MTDKQIPRQAVWWLLIAQAAVLIIHIGYLPYGIWAVAAVIFGWRALVHYGRAAYPSKLLKTLAVAGVIAVLYASFGRQFNLEIASSFLIAVSLLKLLEMRYQRDAYVVVLLGFFVLAVGFLFDQGIRTALAGILSAWLLTTAWIALHQNPLGSTVLAHRSWRTGKYAANILIVSMPLMLVFYLLFPRMAPLWTFKLHSGEARTGLSDNMAPGDFSELSQSADVAFRVSFGSDEPPPRHTLYWRALVLNLYDGRRWTEAQRHADNLWVGDQGLQQFRQGDSVSYEIIQEATQKRWLYGLKYPIPVEKGAGLTVNGVVEFREPVYSRMRYRMESYPETSWNQYFLDNYEKNVSLQLPRHSNPEARLLAQRLKMRYPETDKFVAAVLDYFRQQPFHYTLRPPPLGENDIDQFLLQTRRGFCEHYAGAFVFLARAAGVPARVVTGYQGGEWNKEDRFLTLRQYDAHAWAEVWEEKKGWVRVDPTAVVAPERIESGLEQAVAEEGSFLEDSGFSVQKYKDISWLNKLRLQLDSAEYYWQRWVLSYDQDTQKGFLNGILGIADYKQMLKVLAASLVVFFTVATLILWLKNRPPRRDPFMRQWMAFEAKARLAGYEVEQGEPPTQLLQLIADKQPAWRARLQWLIKEINVSLYRDDQQPGRAVLRELGKLRRQLKTQ